MSIHFLPVRRYAPDVYGLPGAALFLSVSEDFVNRELADFYGRNSNPVAFIDESFETEADETFYVIAVAVVDNDRLAETRSSLHEFYGGEPLHAGPMYRRAEFESLHKATHLVAHQNEGMDIDVCAPIEDGNRDMARAKCLAAAVTKVHRDFSAMLFVLDSLSTPTEEKLDHWVFNDLRRNGGAAFSRDTVAVHCKPSQEVLLGMPDIVAWSYRQEHFRSDGTWFEPLREFTEVTVL